MKKVICDVCGTAYPESSEQCPICGCAKPVDLGENTDAAGEGAAGTTYTYVKGGRFSKSNVRKRNKAAGFTRPMDTQDDEEYNEPESSGSKGLVIAVIVLVLAIVAVLAYIAMLFFGNGAAPEDTGAVRPSAEQTQTTAATEVPTTTEADLSCTGLKLGSDELTILAAGESVLIHAIPQPSDTIDPLQFLSSNPAVAAVNEQGKVTAVAPGEAEITVTCGDYTAICKIVCDFEEEPTEPEETVSAGNYGMFIDGQNVETRRFKNEVTLPYQKTFKLTIMDLDTKEVLDVDWVSGNESIVTVEGNTVTAVSSVRNQMTKITCTVGDTTYTCIVRIG